MSTINNEIMFDKYLRNQLTDSERLRFEQKLTEDVLFKTDFEKHRAFTNHLHDAFFKEELNQIHQNVIVKKSKTKYRLLIPAIAASIALLLGVFFWQEYTHSSSYLYQSYYTPDPGLPTVMGKITSNYEFNNAMVDYKMGDYKKALQTWNTLLKKEPQNDTLQYFTAMAHMNLGNFKSAETQLEILKNNNNSAFYKESKWFLALLYLKADNKQRALELLQSLPKSQQTEKLIKQLN